MAQRLAGFSVLCCTLAHALPSTATVGGRAGDDPLGLWAQYERRHRGVARGSINLLALTPEVQRQARWQADASKKAAEVQETATAVSSSPTGPLVGPPGRCTLAMPGGRSPNTCTNATWPLPFFGDQEWIQHLDQEINRYMCALL